MSTFFKKEKDASTNDVIEITSEGQTSSNVETNHHTHGRFVANGHTERRLKQRQVNLIAIGGSIGTALFVTIGSGLAYGGCGNLLISFAIHSALMYLITITIGEMVCYMPFDSPFISGAGRFFDPALEFAAGYNFYIMVSLYVPFEITAVNGMIHYWRSDYSPVATFVPQIVIYLALNILAVKWYGESEFVLAIGKLILAIALMFFTFITMVGGNPKHDAYGFRNFEGVHNAFPEYIGSGASAFWYAYMKAIFTIVAPEYLSMVAGEAENPRKTMPTAFKSIIYRLSVFYVGGALCSGIVLKYNDPNLIDALTSGAAGAGISPYVIAMKNMNIQVFPHIVNALCISSSFSAGNSLMYCSSRSLFALAKKGFAPKIFTYTTSNGVPIAALLLATGWSCLALMQLGDTGATALNWMVNLCTAAQISNYFMMMITYIGFYRACKAQGFDRLTMPLVTWATKYQPYPCYFCLVIIGIIITFLGAQAFIPFFDVDSLLYYYLMVWVDVALYVLWKVVKKTKIVKPEEADLTTGLAEIDRHEQEFYTRKHLEKDTPSKWWEKLMDYVF